MRAMAALLICGSLAAPAAWAEPQRFAPGDWIVIRGHLADCPAWQNRIVDVEEVPADGEVELLDLVKIDVRGMTRRDLYPLIRRAYAKAIAGDSRPPRVRIEHHRELRPDLIEEARWSFEAMRTGWCPGRRSPPPRDDLRPEDRRRHRS